MADDIVTRLRAAARTGDLPLGVSFDCDAVADEIERLRAEVERLRALVDDYENGINWYTTCTNCAKLMDVNYDQYYQIERLRAAGDALAHLMPHAHLSVPCRPPQGTPLDECCSECAALAAWKEARRG